MGHATLERVFLFGTRSADHIRASGHGGRVVMGPVLHSKTGRIHGCTRTLRGNVKFFLHRGRRVAEFGRYRGNIGLSATERPEDLWVHGLGRFPAGKCKP